MVTDPLPMEKGRGEVGADRSKAKGRATVATPHSYGETRGLVDVLVADGSHGSAELLDEILDSPHRTETYIGVRIASAGDGLQMFHWTIEVLPERSVRIALIYGIGPSGTAEGVTDAIEAGGIFTVVRTSLILSSDDMQLGRWVTRLRRAEEHNN